MLVDEAIISFPRQLSKLESLRQTSPLDTSHKSPATAALESFSDLESVLEMGFSAATMSCSSSSSSSRDGSENDEKRTPSPSLSLSQLTYSLARLEKPSSSSASSGNSSPPRAFPCAC